MCLPSSVVLVPPSCNGGSVTFDRTCNRARNRAREARAMCGGTLETGEAEHPEGGGGGERERQLAAGELWRVGRERRRVGGERRRRGITAWEESGSI